LTKPKNLFSLFYHRCIFITPASGISSKAAFRVITLQSWPTDRYVVLIIKRAFFLFFFDYYLKKKPPLMITNLSVAGRVDWERQNVFYGHGIGGGPATLLDE
jgi:hypothetical protein